METAQEFDVTYVGTDHVIVNGQKWERMDTTGQDCCRHMYRSPCGDYLMKKDEMEVGILDRFQCESEAAVWSQLEDEDRQHFTAILWSKVSEYGDWGAVITPFYSDWAEAWGVDEDIVAVVDILTDKYELEDMGRRQWKVLPDGTPIIHDYGCSAIIVENMLDNYEDEE